ncbi:MAG: F0F1 ATP synthase subunit B [Pseudomonadota bacterium]
MTITVAQADTGSAAQDTQGASDGGAAEGDGHSATTVEVPLPVDGEGVNVPIQGGEESLFPPFDFSAFPSHLFWIVISFGLLYYFVNKLIVPQVGGIIEDRRDRIASDQGEAARLQRETDEVIALYEQELSEARHKAYGIAQERREEIKADQARQQAETEASLDKKIADAEKEIAARRDAALADVDTIATEAAQMIVAQLTGLALSQDEVKTAIERQGGSHASV